MGYRVKIIGPSGRETYLAKGKEVTSWKEATYYPHPSNAREAAEGHRNRLNNEKVLFVVEHWREKGP